MSDKTRRDAIKYLNNRKVEDETEIKLIKESDERAKELGLSRLESFEKSSKMLIDYYTSDIELCERTLSDLQKT